MNLVLSTIFYLFLVPASFIESVNEIPEFLLFLGRFHPLILHLPIGGILLVFYFDVLGRIRKKYPDSLIKNGLGFSSVFAILACVLGYFLSLEGGYAEKITDIHMWTGIGTAILITLLFLLKKSSKEKLKKLFFPLFVLTIILISITGHYGSILTHGDNFITQYSPLNEEKEKPKIIDSLQYFSDVIYPILEAKCVQCHNATKQKGELSFVSETMILKGGKEGEVLLPGSAIGSNMIKRVVLPLGDEKHMPPAGKNQITSNELWLLKHWINNGANFKDKALAYQQNDTLSNLLDNYLEKDLEVLSEASITAINKVMEAGFSVHRIVTGQPHLSVKFIKDSISREAMSTLKGISKQLVRLDVNNTDLTDDMTKSINTLKRLEELRLDNTKISNKTLNYLIDLKDIKILNLHHTLVDNKGVAMIVNKISPANIYVWNTKVDKGYAKELMQNSQTLIHHGIFEGFAEIKPLKPPKLFTEQTIFADSLMIAFNEPLRKAKLYYTIDGTEPDSTSLRYTQPFKITNSINLKAKMYQAEWLPSPTMQEEFFKIKYKIKDYTILHQPSTKYPGGHKVFDFIEGSISFSDGKWAGFEGDNLITMINFEEPLAIESISVSSLQDAGSWILFPKRIEMYTRNENTSFRKIGTINYDATNEEESKEIRRKRFKLEFPKTNAKYIKIVVHNIGKLPKWHQGAGEKGWLFVDEILIQ
ncbi:FN3 associated domain-containing protein [Aquimarina sp. AU474]|uniref:FN3 associated domain-containing protein n=1 Tax=Aquimarina sp. AU474 TaxID=2108529 RepID=UPI000D6910CD|nr:FN3 associated domain-containing protein [Aquimarina sp. AU474]